MKNNKMELEIIDRMIHDEPMRWQTVEFGIKENIFFLMHLNNYIKNSPIHELFVDEIPLEFEMLFDLSTTEEINIVREDLLSCLN